MSWKFDYVPIDVDGKHEKYKLTFERTYQLPFVMSPVAHGSMIVVG